MLYLTLCKAHAPAKERIARRLEYVYPEGLKVLGEYWTFGADPAVVLVTEGDDPGPIMAATAAWDDAFEFTTVPAITAEEGIGLAKAALAQEVMAFR